MYFASTNPYRQSETFLILRWYCFAEAEIHFLFYSGISNEKETGDPTNHLPGDLGNGEEVGGGRAPSGGSEALRGMRRIVLLLHRASRSGGRGSLLGLP